MIDTYEKAYTEILEILKYLPKEEYNKIPKEKIEFYEKNKDKDYKFVFDINKSIDEQNVSRKTKVIIVSLFKDFFATELQKEKIKNILKSNEATYQNELKVKYNPNNIFENKKIENVKENTDLHLINDKENIFTRFFYKIKSIFIKNKS